MSIKKTYIPAKPRSSKLVGASMSGGVAGGVSSSSAGSTDPNSHSHLNKRVLDTITQEMLDNALREILGVESTEEATDENFFSALRTLAEIINNNEVLKGLFLSKVEADIAKGKITFEQGLESQGLTKLVDTYFGDFQSGMHTGQGGTIDSAGNAELESLVLRSFLDVPTIRYNELEYIGEEIIIGAGAVLKGVEHLGDDRYRLTLKLEDGQLNPFQSMDILKGIYNMDEEGNFTDFGTTYVSVSSIDEHEMIVILADESDVVGNSNMPPRKFMHLARIGNFTDTDRQSYISLSAKDRAITQYGGVNAFAKKNKQGKNVRAGVVTTQWGRAEGLEFIENFENLPITKDSDVLYTDTLLYNKQIKVDYEGIVIKEYIDRGQWFEGMECQVTETTIDEVWIEAEKFRLIDRPIENGPFTTIEKPTRESDDWMLILSFKEEIGGHAPIIRDGYWYEWNPALDGEDKYQNTGVRAEGIKGDGNQQKFLSSYEKPIRPTGDAAGWSNIPDEEDAPDVPPEIVGSNLYDRQYLISNGWTSTSGRVFKNVNTIGGDNLIATSKFKANTQYKLDYNMSGQSGTSNIVIEYASGGADVLPLKVESLGTYISIANRTVASIRLGNGLINVFDTTSIYEMNQGAVQAKPIWTIFRNITNGVASEWSIPVKWLGEGTPGKKGDKGDGITMKAPVQNYAELIALPKANNVNGDARIVKIGSNSPTNDGHLWVWNTEVNPASWFDAGKFQGQPGDKSYFHIAYCSYPERKVIGATAAANKIAMEFSQYADGGEYAGRKATHQGTYADWTDGGEDANSPWRWQEVKGDKGDKGDKGNDGTSVRIVGKRATKADLEETWSVLGDGFITEDTGHLHVWDGSGDWLDVGKIQGDTSYFHVKYSDDGGETFTSKNGEDLGSWMGTYVDFIEEDSDDPTDYKWIRAEGVKGDDGANYLPMGEWDSGTEYEKTLMGIPLVKVYAGGGYQVYTLYLKEGVSKNVKPWESFSGEDRHWDLANSISGLTYMERAYAERLQAEIIDTVLLNADTIQAELITAEKIEALDIVHPSGKYSLIDGKLKVQEAEIEGKITATSGDVGQFAIENGELVASYSRFAYVGPSYVQINSKIKIRSSGIIISNSYGGTLDHPSVVEWDTEIYSFGVKVGSMEMRTDGIYKNGIKIL